MCRIAFSFKTWARPHRHGSSGGGRMGNGESRGGGDGETMPATPSGNRSHDGGGEVGGLGGGGGPPQQPPGFGGGGLGAPNPRTGARAGSAECGAVDSDSDGQPGRKRREAEKVNALPCPKISDLTQWRVQLAHNIANASGSSHPGRLVAWIGEAWKANAQLRDLDTARDRYQALNCKLYTGIVGMWRRQAPEASNLLTSSAKRCSSP